MGDTRRLFLLFNHAVTEPQRRDAETCLDVTAFVPLPKDLQNLWSQVPPDENGLFEYLAPVRRWLKSQSKPGDFVLIQGDFGAVYLMVRFALDNGLSPIYSATVRTAHEEPQPDGSIRLTHYFSHQRFRFYGR